MSEQTKKVALPAFLPKRLEAFKIVKNDQQSYLLRDKLLNKVHDMEPWQFFLLEVLPGCEDYPKLCSVFQDRFGRPIQQREIESFFASLADRQLLDFENPTHALLEPFKTKSYEVKDGAASLKSHEAAVHAKPASGNPAAPAAAQGDLQAGLNDAAGFDPRATRWMLPLFDPRPMLRLLSPAVHPLRHAVYLIPLLVLAAVMLCSQYSYLLRGDLEHLHAEMSLLIHVVFSLFTVNLAVTLTTAFIAHAYRATVSKIGISIFVGFLPRFVAQVSHTEQLSRRERMWLNAGPLLTRLVIFSFGVLLWYNTRDSGTLSPKIGMALGLICAFDLLFVSGNPMVKGSGYQLLAAFTNEPHLHGKAYKTLLNQLRGTTFKQSDSLVLAGFASVTALYSFILIAIAAAMVGAYLQTVMLGGTAIVIAILMGLYLARRAYKRLTLIEAAYERSLQFERWRKRTLPEAAGEAEDELKPASGWSHFIKVTTAVTLLILLVLPYPYEPSGQFVVHPSEQQQIATDVEGVIDEVYFDGGDTLKKGTVLAKLNTAQLEAQVKVQEGVVAEQVAVVADLKARPKPEEVQVALRELDIAKEQERFSQQRVPRFEEMVKQGTASQDELDQVRKQYQVDAAQVLEKKAALDLVKAGVTKEQIDAAVSKLAAQQDQLALDKDKLRRAVLTMPIDGTLLTLHLREKINSFLERGKPFAVAENTGAVTVEIEIAETDIAEVAVGNKVEVRPMAFSTELFEGKVTLIDRNVTSQSFGTVVKVLARVENADQLLRTGMTGQAKVQGTSMPVWQAFSRGIQRFLTVQVWSWIP